VLSLLRPVIHPSRINYSMNADKTEKRVTLI
jgi:hypothetical protein